MFSTMYGCSLQIIGLIVNNMQVYEHYLAQIFAPDKPDGCPQLDNTFS